MRYYQLQVELQEYLVPKLIDFIDSRIVEETLLKLANIKKMSDFMTFGTQHSESTADLTIVLSREDRNALEAFLKKTCGNANVEVNECEAYNETNKAYHFQLDAHAFHKNLLPLLKDDIEKLSTEQLEAYQKKSENRDYIQYYKDYLLNFKLLQMIVEQFKALEAKSDEFTKGQLNVLFTTLRYFTWQLDTVKSKRHDADFLRAIRPAGYVDLTPVPKLNNELLQDVVEEIFKSTVKNNPALKGNPEVKELKKSLKKFAETAHYHPPLSDELINTFSLFKTSVKTNLAAQPEEKNDNAPQFK